MNRTLQRVVLPVFMSLVATAAACGSGDGDEPTAAVPIAADPTPTAIGAVPPAPVVGQVLTNPDNGGLHVAAGSYVNSYTESPATSGAHWFAPNTPARIPSPARWGEYNFVIPDEVLVHNLEHGGIGIHYNCPEGCEQLVGQLSGLVPRNPSQFILSPYTDMPARIAITAWRHSLYLDAFDEAAIRSFINDHKDRAPESIKGNTF